MKPDVRSSAQDGTIRRLRRSDIAQVSALICNTLTITNLRDYGLSVVHNLCLAYSPRALRALARRREIFVYQRGRRIEGTLSLEGCVVQALFVAPDLQHRGVGRALMCFAEETGRRRGVAELRLASSVTAAGFYRKMGFAFTGEGGDATYGRVLHMRKIL